ncbi:Hypothetical protein PENO1_088480 [Penicillium occitanis (nom. inval.)]|nr:Hypothetical protein PENO1_088480 [Penicillium occitanis (nom. inval.)]PCG94782.1 hypothetical protein PENOC_081020 [Penicillium occitanis (nom. inval.)]
MEKVPVELVQTIAQEEVSSTRSYFTESGSKDTFESLKLVKHLRLDAPIRQSSSEEDSSSDGYSSSEDDSSSDDASETDSSSEYHFILNPTPLPPRISERPNNEEQREEEEGWYYDSDGKYRRLRTNMDTPSDSSSESDSSAEVKKTKPRMPHLATSAS